MDKKTIQAILKDELETKIPSTDVRLWHAVKEDLVAGKIFQQGEKMNTVNSPRIPRIAFVTLILVALVSLAFFTPQGRALAQEFVSQFFTRTESDSYFSLYEDVPFEDTTPFYEQCGIPIFPTCSVEQVRGMVDFEVKEIGAIPETMYYVGSTGGPDFIELKYGYEDRRHGNLSVGVEAIGRPSSVGTGIAAKSADIQPVQIGDLPGEYYTGGLFQDDQGNVTWLPDEPTQTLRWEDGGSTYTLIYHSAVVPLTKEDLVALAESMTTEPVVKRPLPPGFIR